MNPLNSTGIGVILNSINLHVDKKTTPVDKLLLTPHNPKMQTDNYPYTYTSPAEYAEASIELTLNRKKTGKYVKQNIHIYATVRLSEEAKKIPINKLPDTISIPIEAFYNKLATWKEQTNHQAMLYINIPNNRIQGKGILFYKKNKIMEKSYLPLFKSTYAVINIPYAFYSNFQQKLLRRFPTLNAFLGDDMFDTSDTEIQENIRRML